MAEDTKVTINSDTDGSGAAKNTPVSQTAIIQPAVSVAAAVATPVAVPAAVKAEPAGGAVVNHLSGSYEDYEAFEKVQYQKRMEADKAHNLELAGIDSPAN